MQVGQGAYPGSPWFALEGMRDDIDNYILKCSVMCFQQLRHNIRDKRAGLHERDFYEGLMVSFHQKKKNAVW